MKMKIPINLLMFLSICLSTLFFSGMEGCNEDAEEPAVFVEAFPPSGSTIQKDATIVATFDSAPIGLSVSGGKFSLAGSDAAATIVGPFTPGALRSVYIVLVVINIAAK